MNEVVVDKSELLATLKKNRDDHVNIYKDALEGVRVEYEKKLKTELQKLEDGKDVSGQVYVERPRSHEEEYNEVIEMLEMSVEKEITLTRHEFKQYVQDSWVSMSEKNLLRNYALSSSNSANYMAIA